VLLRNTLAGSKTVDSISRIATVLAGGGGGGWGAAGVQEGWWGRLELLDRVLACQGQMADEIRDIQGRETRVWIV